MDNENIQTVPSAPAKKMSKRQLKKEEKKRSKKMPINTYQSI